MGVYGLTTYLREKKRLLSTTTVLSPATKGPVPIVVDGWSFIYDLYNTSNLPWVYGGEYREFDDLVTLVVESWIKVGLHVYFVFDGACPDLKFPTVISRLVQSHIQPAQLFFRTSPASRSSNRFLNETRILPPLAYSTCIHALDTLRHKTDKLELHFGDEEGDPYAVELAGRLGGYVLGNDSDFVILNSEGYRGYIPLDELVWNMPEPEDSIVKNDDDDFQMVRKPKAKHKVNDPKSVGGLLPPENMQDLTLTFISYSPQTLATHLKIPVSLLPLFGALVGNDYSKESEINSRKIQTLFFDRQLSSTQRIDRVANAIHSVVSPGSQKRKSKHQFGSVMDLIDRTVNTLLARLTTALGSREIDDIVDKIVTAALQYAIPKCGGDLSGREGLWVTSVCALHDPESCPFLPMISRNVMRQTEESSQTDPRLLEAREFYLDAYRNGHLSQKNMDILSTSSSWPRLFLENPDLETVGRSIGAPIRRWIYTILDDTVGTPSIETDDTASNASERDSIQSDSDDDELIDVVESDDEPDYLAPLKGELHRLQSGSEDEATEPPASIISHRIHRSGPPIITEYLRRGTRIATEPLTVTPMSALLSTILLPDYGTEDAPPLVLRSEEDRLTVFLRALGSDYAAVHQLSPDILLPVLALRWVVYTLHLRWRDTGSKDREKERWKRTEARCFLMSFSQHSSDIQGSPPIQDRNVQLTAQVLMALDTIQQFSQVLLLTQRVQSTAHNLSGKLFHALLTGTASNQQCPPSGVWEALETGLDDAFQQDHVKNVKRSKAEKKPAQPVPEKGSKINPPKRGLFALLGDLDG